MAQILCVYKEVEILKEAASKAPSGAVAIVSYDEKPGMQAIGATAPDLPPKPAFMRPSPVITSISAMARSACLPASTS